MLLGVDAALQRRGSRAPLPRVVVEVLGRAREAVDARERRVAERVRALQVRRQVRGERGVGGGEGLQEGGEAREGAGGEGEGFLGERVRREVRDEGVGGEVLVWG